MDEFSAHPDPKPHAGSDEKSSIEIHVVTNSLTPDEQTVDLLIGLQNVFYAELPNINKEFINRHVFDLLFRLQIEVKPKIYEFEVISKRWGKL